jgi:uncharacterized protein (TIGR01777 family)
VISGATNTISTGADRTPIQVCGHAHRSPRGVAPSYLPSARAQATKRARHMAEVRGNAVPCYASSMTESVPSFYPEGSPVISRVCVFGASGLLGTALTAGLRRGGSAVTPFTRKRAPDQPGLGFWDPEAGAIDVEHLEHADAVVNLAGENLADGRWTPARKRRLWQSRVDSTALLSRTLAKLERKPLVLVNASAVGFYGDRGEEAVYEESPRGTGFLAELCEAWEAATQPAAAAGIRVVRMRYGVVLSAHGGALPAMMRPIRMGFGGRLGSGEQRMPWIALADAVGATRFALRHPDISGALNAVAPEPLTNAQFTHALARVMGRPAALPVPGFALKVALGAEMASEMLLHGANVRPRRLEVTGYRFEYPRIDDALEALLK